MAIEDVQNRAGFHFDISAQAGSRLAEGLMTQVILLVMENGKGAQQGESKRALIGRPCGAKERRESEIVGKDMRLVVVPRPPAAAFELLQRGNVWPLILQYAADAPEVVPFIDTHTRVNVVGQECQLPGDHLSDHSGGPL